MLHQTLPRTSLLCFHEAKVPTLVECCVGATDNHWAVWRVVERGQGDADGARLWSSVLATRAEALQRHGDALPDTMLFAWYGEPAAYYEKHGAPEARTYRASLRWFMRPQAHKDIRLAAALAMQQLLQSEA